MLNAIPGSMNVPYSSAFRYRTTKRWRPHSVCRTSRREVSRMTDHTLPVWRSMLFVPVTAERFVNGAARRGADAIILDLEDAVAASEKERARMLVPDAAKIVSRGGADVVVRDRKSVAEGKSAD